MNDSKRSLPSWLPLAGGLVVAVAALLLIWAVFIKAEDDSEQDGPRVVSVSELADAAEDLGRPIYWAGEQTGKRYELADSDSGRVYVRYIDRDTEPGARSTNFTTVVTYPVPDAAVALRRGAKTRPGAELARSDDGALLLIDPATPHSIRVAYPGADEQVEVYSPDVAAGVKLVKSGQIQPVE
jgi:hypothetical protein